MANIRITDLPEVPSVTSTSEYVLEQGGNSFKITLAGLLGSGETDISGINVSASGNLNVTGTATLKGAVNVQGSSVLVNSNQNTAGSDAFFEVERGSSSNVALRWDETSDTWKLVENTGTSGSPSWQVNLGLEVDEFIVNSSLNVKSSGTIVLNSNASGTPSSNAELRVERGDETDATLTWDENNDRWDFGSFPVRASNFENNSGVSYATSDTVINAGAGLIGGGDLSSNRTLSIPTNGVTTNMAEFFDAFGNLDMDNSRIDDVNTIVATVVRGSAFRSLNNASAFDIADDKITLYTPIDMNFYDFSRVDQLFSGTGTDRTSDNSISFDDSQNMFFFKSEHTSPNENISQFNSKFANSDLSSGASAVCTIQADGDVFNKNGTYGTLSDVNLKTNIVPASSQWNDIKNIKLKNYKLIDDVEVHGEDAITQLGVIAQDLEESGMSKLVKDSYMASDSGENKIVKVVKHSVLQMKALGALQEAMQRIETLENEIVELKQL